MEEREAALRAVRGGDVCLEIGCGRGVIGGEAGVEVLEGRRRLEEALELLLLWCIRRRDAKILERRAELRT